MDQRNTTIDGLSRGTSLSSASKGKIAFIQAAWHKDIVEQCRIAFIQKINELGHSDRSIDFYEVPGSLEIPLQAKLLAKSGKYAAIVAAGLVVDGGIYRHDFVAQAVINGMMQVQLETEIPVLSVVLTPHHFHESEEHQRFFRDHFVVKGTEAAIACAQTMGNIDAISA